METEDKEELVLTEEQATELRRVSVSFEPYDTYCIYVWKNIIVGRDEIYKKLPEFFKASRGIDLSNSNNQYEIYAGEFTLKLKVECGHKIMKANAFDKSILRRSLENMRRPS